MTEDKAIQGWMLTQEIKELTLKEESLNKMISQIETGKISHASIGLKLSFKASFSYGIEVEVPDEAISGTIRITLAQCKLDLINKKRMLENL